MIAEKINSVVAALGDLGLDGKVSPEVGYSLACARNELRDAAAQAADLEAHVTIESLQAEGGNNG